MALHVAQTVAVLRERKGCAEPALVPVDTCIAIVKEMGGNSLKFFPMGGLKVEYELRSVAEACARNEFILEPTGGITLENFDAILKIRLDAAESSIHDWIEENYDVSPDSYHKTIRAGSATKEDCEVLSVEEGTPLLEVVQVGYLDDGRPFEYVETKFPGDLSVYQTVDSDSIPV